jgi:hypothetical protein
VTIDEHGNAYVTGAQDRPGTYADYLTIKYPPEGVAVAEPQPPVAHKTAPATIARAVLHVLGTSSVLLDISGREVAKLQPGENDVRHLSPGIYFVRQTSSVEREASRVRKVILTR